MTKLAPTPRPARTGRDAGDASPRQRTRDLSEDEFTANVIELCRLLRLYVYHTHDSRRSEPGFLDLMIVGPGGVMFVELKTRTGRLRPEQERVLGLLTAAGAVAVLRRPEHLADGTLAAELRALTHRPARPLPPMGLPGAPVRECCPGGCLIENVAQFGHSDGCVEATTRDNARCEAQRRAALVGKQVGEPGRAAR